MAVEIDRAQVWSMVHHGPPWSTRTECNTQCTWAERWMIGLRSRLAHWGYHSLHLNIRKMPIYTAVMSCMADVAPLADVISYFLAKTLVGHGGQWGHSPILFCFALQFQLPWPVHFVIVDRGWCKFQISIWMALFSKGWCLHLLLDRWYSAQTRALACEKLSVRHCWHESETAS